jgi:hypothetical protein
VKYVSLHKCRICKNISENEYGVHPVSPSATYRPLPTEAKKLIPIEESDTESKKNHHIKQCPICGVFYKYYEHYEYDVAGSVDELYLTRLTPTEAKDLMNEREYNMRIGHLVEELVSSHLVTKRYAAKGLTSYYLNQEDIEKVVRLLDSNDEDIAMAVLRYLDNITEQWWILKNMHLIEQIANTAAKSDRYKDNPILKQIIWRCGLKR